MYSGYGLFLLLTVAFSQTSQPKTLHPSIPSSVLVSLRQQSTSSLLDTYSMTSVPTAVAISSPSPTGNGGGHGGRNDGVNIDSLSVGVGGSGALLVLIIVPIAVLVCLRKRRNNKVKTTENVAYLYIRTVSQTNKDGLMLNPYVSTSGLIQNEVYSSHTSPSEICSPLYTNHAYLKVDSITGSILNTHIITSTNHANLEDGLVYDIPESADQSHLN